MSGGGDVTHSKDILVEESPIVLDPSSLIDQIKGGTKTSPAPTARMRLDQIMTTHAEEDRRKAMMDNQVRELQTYLWSVVGE